ncbi:MAG TPA: S41 family peptidase [Thermoanaerobaculia bacterium]|nr:S41 family peptidase [Thermoanaerobaculia bacterium]
MLLLAALSASAQPTRTESLVKLCEVWSTVKFLDPHLMTRAVDWDGALVRAIPAVRAATTHEELAKAIGSMLAELNDPASRVVRRDTAAPNSGAVPLFRWEGDVLVVNIGPYADLFPEEAFFTADEQLNPELARAKSAVFDLRSRTGKRVDWVFSALALVTEPVPVPAFRNAFHSGYAPQVGSTSGGYYSGVLVTASTPLRPARGAPGAPARHVFLVRDGLPDAAAGLWWSGRAAIVAERPIGDADVGFVVKEIELGGGWHAAVRVAEPAVAGLQADAVVAATPDDAPMKKALALARDPAPLPARPAPRETAAVPIPLRETPYAQMTEPDLPHRLLALFRLWSVIDRFYPYKHLIGDWDAALRDFIPRFEEAKNGSEYALAVMELAARIEDGHTTVRGHAVYVPIVGAVFLPLEVRAVEGRYIVTGSTAPKDVPIAIGDEVVSIDGEPLADRVKRLWKYIPASHETARLNRVLATATRGPREPPAELVVRGADGATRTVKVPRGTWSATAGQKGEIWRVLDGNIGYVDLTRLAVPQVDAMFEALKNTEAIVFDLRGYPKGTAWSIAPRINTSGATVGATFRRVQLSVFSSEMARSGFFFDQLLPKSDKPKYTGRTVMLIDDRTISQAEHTGLFFEAANGTKFVGSHSAGANGDVTNVILPGGITVSFTGHDVRHADGRQLQRIGLVPDVPVTPTVRGIREGKDEVLERAIAFLRQ